METPKTFSLNDANFIHLLHQGKFTDVTLVCEGTMIKCHKIMLAASSTYFEELFTMLDDIKNPVVALKDTSKNLLMKALEFIYCGKIRVHAHEMPEFRRLVEYFKLKIDLEGGDESSLLNSTVPDMMSQDFMSQETTGGNFTMETFQVGSEFDRFEDIDESSTDSDSTLNSRTSSIMLGKSKKDEPFPKRPKVALPHAESKIRCAYCQKYVPERLLIDHQKHCFKNRNRQPLKCPECRQDFEVTTRLRSHISKMHPVRHSQFPNSFF